MGLFDFLKRGEEPVARYEDSVLGPMNWSPDDEAWQGEHGGVRYLLAYDRRATPDPDLLAYAREVLGAAGAFRDAVERAKPRAVAEYPPFADEVRGLQVQSVLVYSRKGVRRALADLAGGREHRAWRAEFRGHECEGVGFDD